MTTTGGGRSALVGPWIACGELAEFRRFCEANGHATRDHANLFLNAAQIRHDGHWMSVTWNKGTRRYTADRRLSLIVQSFAASRAATPRADNQTPKDCTMTTETLGRFGHHPDHAIDFCVEVEAIEGEIADIAAGLTPTMNLDERIARAMTFRVGGDAPSIASKTALRAIEASRRAAPEAAEPVAWCALSIDSKHIVYFDGKPMVMPGRTGNDCHTVPLYAGRAPTDSQAGRDAVEARSQQFEQALKILSHIDNNIGTVLSEHQYHVPGGGSIAAHNIRLAIIELHKFRAALSTTTGRG